MPHHAYLIAGFTAAWTDWQITLLELVAPAEIASMDGQLEHVPESMPLGLWPDAWKPAFRTCDNKW